MKRYTILLSVTLSCLSLQAYVIDDRESFTGREWEFLQHKISKKIDEKRYCFSNTLKKMATGILPFLFGNGAYTLFYKNKPKVPKYKKYVFDDNSYEKIKKERWKINQYNDDLGTLCTVFAFLGSSLAVTITDLVLHSNATFETYEKFVKNWPKNKPFTPKSLHLAFDELFMIYQKYGNSSELYYKKYLGLKNIVSQALLNRFPPPIVIYNSAPTIYYF